MKIEQTPLNGVLLITPDHFEDARGCFSETFSKRRTEEAFGGVEFVQDNHSVSHDAGTLRGLHYQSPPFAQAKLVRCVRGAVFDVAVDFRAGSVTYGQWFGTELSAEDGKQMFVPAGFLHGFVTLSPATEVGYKCSHYYVPEAEGSIRWDSLNIEWPMSGGPRILSEKDRNAPAFDDVETPFLLEECA